MDRAIFFEGLAKIAGIPIRLVSKDTETYGERLLVQTEDEESARDRLLQSLGAGKTEWEDYIPDVPIRLYGFRIGEGDTAVILGPAAYGKLNGSAARIYLHRNHIEHFPECSIARMDDIIMLIQAADIGRAEDLNKDPDDSAAPDRPDTVSFHVTEKEIEQYEGLKENHSYIDESVLKNAIMSGDVEVVRKNFEGYFPTYPVVLNDVYKNEEYMAVAATSLFARHAMEAGAASRDALLLSDVCLQKIADCKTIQEMHATIKDAAVNYAELVRRQKEQSSLNLRVEMCKKIIINHRLKPIGADEIAEKMGISKGYLLKLFRKEEGITVREYIMRTKMEAAANMLKYSDRHIGEISDYLAFDSISYFSRAFTRIYGMSPKEYRKKYSRLF